MDFPLRRAALIAAIRNRSQEMRDRLEKIKRDGDIHRQRPDMLWYLLLQSAATQGNSRGWQGLFGNPEILESVSFTKLSSLRPNDREIQILAALKLAKIRMQTIKAPRLAKNFELIMQKGGVEAATREMLALTSKEGKVAFIMEFSGIGKKYSRNIWMDIYDPSFRDSIAIDERVKKFAALLGVQSKSYARVEDYFIALARECDIEPWELDRLLYNFTEDFLDAVKLAR